MVTLDVPHVFRVFGGPTGLIRALDRYQPGHGLHYSTVQMWSHRKTVPAKWVGCVLYAAEQEGHRCTEFLTDTAEFGPC